MAKRRTSDEKLYDDLLEKCTPMEWYTITKDYEKRVAAFKRLIDAGADLEFSNDYKKIRIYYPQYCKPTNWRDNLPEGYSVEVIPPGYVTTFEIKGKHFSHEQKKQVYRIFKGQTLIAIEL